ncbi:MAG TPA: hypothetical protein VFF27_00145 [Bacteroidia bacterium]|jgi:hypothetical protein|nr:hypothetical protein [Bacteroidia bacterium]
MSLKDFFTQQGLDITKGLKDSLRSANRNASGKTSDSINFEIFEDGSTTTFQVVANKNIMALEFGRGPTKKSGTGVLKDSIRQWIKDKGIKGSNGISEDSLVFLITRKIHREGYAGTPGLISDVISDELRENIELGISDIIGNEFVKEIIV